MKFNTSILILFFLVHGFSNAQSILKGSVSDENKKPLPGVSVFIPELLRGVQTDADGKFTLDNLPVATLQIQFSMIGFKSQVQKVDSGTSNIDIVLESSTAELEEVLITSNSTKLTDNIPFSANSISSNEMKEYRAPSVMGNLSYEPGVDRITIGNGISKPVIRGLSFDRLLLYSQGTRIENQQWDDHHDLGLSDIGIENVELVRGPSALIYGANALGGAIIFTDEKPAPVGTTIGDANLGFASNTLGIDADAGIRSSKQNGFFYGLRVGGKSHTSYVQGEDEDEKKPEGEEEEEFAANSKFASLIGKANAGFSKKWGISKLSYSFFSQQIGIIEDESADTAATEDEEEQREREFEAPYQDVSTHIISLENTFFTGKSKINLNVAYQMNDRKEFEPLPDKQKELAIGLKLNTITYDAKWSSNAEKKAGLILGTQGTFLENRNNGLESLVPDADVSDISGYGLFRYDTDKLNFLAGLRYDLRHIEAESYEENEMESEEFILYPQGDTIMKPETDFESDYKPVSFSAGVSYHVSKEFNIKLNAATGFSAPNYAELATFGKHEGTFRFERGDDQLKVEQNVEGDIGLMYENKSFTLSASAYSNKVKDYIYIANTGDSIIRISDNGNDTLPLYDYRQADATLSGLETSFDIHPSTYKWIDLKISYAIIRGKFDKGGNLPYIPANKLIAELKLTKEKIWAFKNAYVSLIASNYAEQKNVADYELVTEGYTLLDIHIGGAFNLGKHNTTLDLFCTNLLNTAYYNQLSLVKYIGVRDMGRNIGVAIHFPF